MAMTKAAIVEIVHEKIGLGIKESTEIVEQVFGILKETLEGGEKIKISGFGNFNIHTVHTSIHERKKGVKLGDTFGGYAL
jgi:nucleoid DNA-binding protein